MSPVIISINACCLTNTVDNIIRIDIIKMNIFILLGTFLEVNDDNTNNILTAQCILGKQFIGGLSIKYIKFTNIFKILLFSRVGLATVVGYITNIILDMIILRT